MKILTIILMLSVVTGCATTEHDNYVYLDTDSSIAFPSSPFELTGYSYTENQPWGGVSWIAGSKALDAKAGRHNSTEPADWFKNLFPYLIGDDTYSTSPSQLNFAFSGNLTLSVNGTSITLTSMGWGQGHDNEGNNWWMGCTASNCTWEGPGYLVFQVNNVCVEIAPEYANDRFWMQTC